MKRLFVVGVILLSALLSVSKGSEQGYQEDGLLTAIYAVDNPIEKIQVYLNYTVVTEDKEEEHSAFLNFEKEGITFLEICGKVITDTSEGDEPLEVFPHPIVGEIKNLTGYAQAMSDQKVIASGGTFRKLLKKREAISFELEWWPIEQIIYYDLPIEYLESEVEIRLKTDSSSHYLEKSTFDPYISGFRVFISPSISNLKYEVWNQNEILETGTLVFSNSNPNRLTGSGSAFNFHLSGITRGSLNPEIIYKNISIDGFVWDEETQFVEAKVFILDKDYGNLVGTIEFLGQVPLEEVEILCYEKDKYGIEPLEVSILDFKIKQEISRLSFFVEGVKTKTLILVVKYLPRTPQADKLRFNAYLYNELYVGGKG